MKSIKFLGAAGTVTGSGYILTSNSGSSILIDLGMFQGPPEIEQLNQNPVDMRAGELDAVILTHAHLDHCGRLPLATKGGFKGNFYMTAATADLTEVVLLDAEKIARRDLDKEPLYTYEDVVQTIPQIKIVKYHERFKAGDFEIEMVDAGHLLGSASLIIKEGGKTIVFSGDLGNSPQLLVAPTEHVSQADYVVMETTYGDREHPDEDSNGILQEEINITEEEGSVLLIPCFSLNRTQDILYRIKLLKESGKVKDETPVFMDSPMGITATEIYLEHKNLFNEDLKKVTTRENPFDFQNLFSLRKSRGGKLIKNHKGAKVIIAGSGMMTGGRILSHAAATFHIARIGF